MKSIPLLLLAIAFAPVAGASEAAPAPVYVECQIHRHSWPVFPQRMLRQGITHGTATVMLEVDTTGAVTDRLVVAYTHPEFRSAALDAVKSWTFEPGTYDGKPVISTLKVTFEFTVNGIIVYERHFDAIRPEDYAANQYAYFAHGSDTLDRKPVALSTTPPPYPELWAKEGRTGHVTVRFFIDETGHTRMPFVIGPTDTLLASSAAAALKEWRFQPPVAGGKPVLAYAEQVFVFEPPLAKAPGS